MGPSFSPLVPGACSRLKWLACLFVVSIASFTQRSVGRVYLPLHGAQAAHLPHDLRRLAVCERKREGGWAGTYPVVHLPVLARAARVRHLVLGVVAVDQVLQDGSALEDADGLAVREGVGNGRDAAVGVDLEEPRLLLTVNTGTAPPRLNPRGRVLPFGCSPTA